MKKLFASVLSVMLVLALAGCESTPTASSDAESSQEQSEATSAAATSADNADSTEEQSEAAEPASSLADSETDNAASEAPSDEPSEGGKTLVVVYSASGNTKAVAEYIVSATGADLFEITPTEPYTDADLNWTDPDSRVSREHDDESLRNVELTSTSVDNWADYDKVFIGYPIWWGIAAWPTDTFVKANDFTGKTVIPFCTSSTSGIGSSGTLLAEMAGTGNWLEGQRFQSRADESTVKDWVDGLGL